MKKVVYVFRGSRESFDRLPRKVLEWAMRKKGIPEVFAKSVMSLHEGAKTRIRVDSELSEEFEVKVGMHQGSVLSPFFCSCHRCCHQICQRGCAKCVAVC